MPGTCSLLALHLCLWYCPCCHSFDLSPGWQGPHLLGIFLLAPLAGRANALVLLRQPARDPFPHCRQERNRRGMSCLPGVAGHPHPAQGMAMPKEEATVARQTTLGRCPVEVERAAEIGRIAVAVPSWPVRQEDLLSFTLPGLRAALTTHRVIISPSHR